MSVGTTSVSTTFDLLLRGGRMIDPAFGVDGAKDVAIRNGKIAAVQSYVVCQVMTNGNLRAADYLDPTPRPLPLWGQRLNRVGCAFSSGRGWLMPLSSPSAGRSCEP